MMKCIVKAYHKSDSDRYMNGTVSCITIDTIPICNECLELLKYVTYHKIA